MKIEIKMKMETRMKTEIDKEMEMKTEIKSEVTMKMEMVMKMDMVTPRDCDDVQTHVDTNRPRSESEHCMELCPSVRFLLVSCVCVLSR